MKKINLLGYLSMALVFIFISCNSEEGILEINKKSFNQQTICGDEMVVDLIAGQHINVGTVTVSNDETNLYVTYNATGDWSITETHLYVGAEADIPLTKPGNPKFGHFPYHGDSEDPFVIPLANLDGSFVVVAHAVVDRIVNGQSVQDETAFGCGDKEFPGKRWGCYFDYEKQECEEEEECENGFAYRWDGDFKTCFLDDSFTQWGWTNDLTHRFLWNYKINNGFSYRLPLVVKAEDCDLTNSIEIGYIHIQPTFERIDGSTNLMANIKYVITNVNYTLCETNLFLGLNKYPQDNDGVDTVSTDKYGITTEHSNITEFIYKNVMWPTDDKDEIINFIGNAKVNSVN